MKSLNLFVGVFNIFLGCLYILLAIQTNSVLFHILFIIISLQCLFIGGINVYLNISNRKDILPK